MELSVESSCQHVTWKVRDFFELPSEIGYSLDSPEFLFADDGYCLRLYPNGSRRNSFGVCTEMELVRLASTLPYRSVSCKIGNRWRAEKGSEVDTYWPSSLHNKLPLTRSFLQENRDKYVPDGIFTVLFSMRLKEQSSAESEKSAEAKNFDTKEENNGLQGQSAFFSSRLCSLKMELSTESPCQHVTWKIPDFFQLLSKIGYSQNSPEFRFAGEKFCLRFHPKGDRNADKVDTGLQLLRLTSTFPERVVLYKFGCRWRLKTGIELDAYTHTGTLIDGFGFCLSQSEIEKKKDLVVPHGTLTVLCSMHMKEQSSGGSPQPEEARNSQAEKKQEVLPGTSNSVSCAAQTETSNSVSCAVQTETSNSVSCAVQTETADSVIDREINKIEEWSTLDKKDVALLSESMKNLPSK